jgi:hypothetical protein
MKPALAITALTFVVLGTALPASAAPNPSPVAPTRTGTACAAVIGHNPQASDAGHSAPPAQMNFEAVGNAFCFA